MKTLIINLLAAVSFIALTATVSLANASEPKYNITTLADALICENICVSFDAQDKAMAYTEAAMQNMSPEKIGKAHALANTEIEMVEQLLNSAMADLRIAGVEQINILESEIKTWEIK